MEFTEIKIITFSGRGQIVHVITEEISLALRAHGAEVKHILYEGGTNPLFDEIESFRPDFLVTVDYQISRQRPDAFRDYPWMRHAAWWTDDPVMLGIRGVAEGDLHFVVDTGWAEPLMGVGAKEGHVFELPLCTNPDVMRPPDKIPLDAESPRPPGAGDDLSAADYLRMMGHTGNAEDYSHDVSFLGSTRFRHDFQNFLQALRPGPQTMTQVNAALNKIADEPGGGLIPKIGHMEFFDAYTQYMMPLHLRETAAALTRIRFCQDKMVRPAVYGPQDWENYLDADQLRGPLDPVLQVPLLYRGTKVNLNFHAGQLRTGINQRCFDVPACGGFVLSDYRDDLRKYFDEGETAFFFDRKDYVEKVFHWLERDEEREALAERARARVLERHTYEMRALQMLNRMKAALDESASPAPVI